MTPEPVMGSTVIALVLTTPGMRIVHPIRFVRVASARSSGKDRKTRWKQGKNTITPTGG